ncbi:MAG: ABC-F family ATP-binding cassette domain-containing protein, partial [Clostridia bacterium]|nr:ABC-F family ATP-binding cassette domain-containing protein [Clostridia bacterium]
DLPARKEILRMELPRLSSPDGTLLAENVSLSVNAADHIGIIGRNGAGKTTLMRLIAQELSGRKDIKLFYMPQNYADLLQNDATPIEFLAPTGEKEAVTAARTYLGSVRNTADEAEQPISRLSGGQKAKLLFVKMALEGYNVLLLDEPTRNFSPLSAPVIRRILREFGGCIISVTHDRKYLAEVCGKVYRMTESGLEPV